MYCAKRQSQLISTARLITTFKICKVKPKVVFVSWLINVKQYKVHSLMNSVCYDSCLETHNVWVCASNESIFGLHHLKCKRKAWEKKMGGCYPLIQKNSNMLISKGPCSGLACVIPCSHSPKTFLFFCTVLKIIYKANKLINNI